jgi:hypothetical protein
MIGLRHCLDGPGPGGEEVVLEHLGVGLVGHLLDVGPGREGLGRAGDDDAADRVVGLRRRQGLASSPSRAVFSAFSASGRFRRIRVTPGAASGASTIRVWYSAIARVSC